MAGLGCQDRGLGGGRELVYVDCSVSSLDKPVSMDFVSQILWHFVRDSRDGKTKAVLTSSFDVLEKYILKDDGTGELKRYPNPKATPPNDKFYARDVVLEMDLKSAGGLSASPAALMAGTMSDLSDPQRYLEPRAVCFADIPFNFLPIHMARYSGIGLGFRRKNLTARFPDLRPVAYIPRLTVSTIGQHVMPGTDQLHTYVKVESVDNKVEDRDGEPFDAIYREREWRRPDDVPFDGSSLACFVFRDQTELDSAYASPKFRKFLDDKVAFLCREDFFETV